MLLPLRSLSLLAPILPRHVAVSCINAIKRPTERFAPLTLGASVLSFQIDTGPTPPFKMSTMSVFDTEAEGVHSTAQ